MITQETRRAVYKRDSGKCQQCGRYLPFSCDAWDLMNKFDLHHINQRYKGADRDEAWNLAVLCAHGCNRSVPGKGGLTAETSRRLKTLSIERRGRPLSDIDEIHPRLFRARRADRSRRAWMNNLKPAKTKVCPQGHEHDKAYKLCPTCWADTGAILK